MHCSCFCDTFRNSFSDMNGIWMKTIQNCLQHHWVELLDRKQKFFLQMQPLFAAPLITHRFNNVVSAKQHQSNVDTMSTWPITPGVSPEHRASTGDDNIAEDCSLVLAQLSSFHQMVHHVLTKFPTTGNSWTTNQWEGANPAELSFKRSCKACKGIESTCRVLLFYIINNSENSTWPKSFDL